MTDHSRSPEETAEPDFPALLRRIVGTWRYEHGRSGPGSIVDGLENAANRLANPALGEAVTRLGNIWMNGTVTMGLRWDDVRLVVDTLNSLRSPTHE